MCFRHTLGRKKRLVIMATLTFSYMVTELVVGYCGNSTALIADSFHMLSDVIALLVAYVSITIAPKSWKRSTYGFARAEILGALVNAVFLLALAFSIFIEAIKRFFNPEKMTQPIWVFGVGCGGLFINVVGLFIFGDHSHSHGHHHGHGHSHGGHGNSGKKHTKVPITKTMDENKEDGSSGIKLSTVSSQSANRNGKSNIQDTTVGEISIPTPDVLPQTPKSQSIQFTTADEEIQEHHIIAPIRASIASLNSSQLNMRAVFLHVFADTLGSIAVLISSALVWITKEKRLKDHNCWKFVDYVDPCLSIVMVIIIAISTWPLLKQTALVLLQTLPSQVKSIDTIRIELVEIDGVVGVEELYVWQLTGNTSVGSVHLMCNELTQYTRITEEARGIFQNVGINSTTIQIILPDNTKNSNIKTIQT